MGQPSDVFWLPALRVSLLSLSFRCILAVAVWCEVLYACLVLAHKHIQARPCIVFGETISFDRSAFMACYWFKHVFSAQVV